MNWLPQILMAWLFEIRLSWFAWEGVINNNAAQNRPGFISCFVWLFLCSVCFRVPRSQKLRWWLRGHRNWKKWWQNDWNEAKGLFFFSPYKELLSKKSSKFKQQNTLFKDHTDHCHVPAASTKCVKDCRRSKIVKKILLPQWWRQAARTANTNYPPVLPLYPSSGKTQSPPTE